MTDLDIIKECRQTGRTRTTTKNLLQKAYYEQMTEIEKTEGELKILQAKLELLKEIENFKSPVEIAYKKVYGGYPPTTPSVDSTDDIRWSAFQNGYNASQVIETPQEEPEEWDIKVETDYLTGKARHKWNVVDKDGNDYKPTPQTPEQVESGMREAFQKAQQTEEWKETQRKIDSNYDEIEWGTAPPKPTSTVFRKKLFDGIKSVFDDPDYEGTHWKLKVDMAVDEVLLHFYNTIPEPYKKENLDEFEKGWNCCLASIEMYMENTDD